MADDTIYVATETFAANVDGVDYMIRKGLDRVRGAHPLYKQTSMYWAPVEDKVTFDVESATAAPGEKRGQPTISAPPAKPVEAISHDLRTDPSSGHEIPVVDSGSEGSDAEIVATPKALQHAEELGIDLSTIKGTGAGGTVTKADVEAAEQARVAGSSK